METPTCAQIVKKPKADASADAPANASALTTALALVITALANALALAKEVNADAVVLALTSALALVNALTSGSEAPKNAETSDEEGWIQGEYQEDQFFSEPKNVRYKHIVDENGIEKCLRDDGCVGIIVGNSYYLTTKSNKQVLNILQFSPRIVDCLLHPGSSDYEKAEMLYQVFSDHYPKMMKKPNDWIEHFEELPGGLISEKLVEYEEGMEIRKYERPHDHSPEMVWTFKINVRIEWIPKGQRYRIIDEEGDCLITDEYFETA